MSGLQPKLDARSLDAARATRGRTILLFLTDRCPVGCAHCSVDSRNDSPTISDFEIFESVVSALCDSAADTIGISGGEPFVEKRGLTYATERLAEAGKRIVPYTSGIWASRRVPPDWVREVIRRCPTVVLSTDAFHERSVNEERFQRAARAIAAEGAWIIVQALDMDGMAERARELLNEVFGDDTASYAEVKPIRPLPYGRAAGLFTFAHDQPGHSFGPCLSLASPVVRYDGRIKACCNEFVIMGGGPAELHGQGSSPAELREALDSLSGDSLLGAIGSVGPGVLTKLPMYRNLSDRRFGSICQLCWAIHSQTHADERVLLDGFFNESIRQKEVSPHQ